MVRVTRFRGRARGVDGHGCAESEPEPVATLTLEPGEGVELAQVNIARLRAPLDDPRLAEFVLRLDDVNRAADAAPGFVWRLQTDAGNTTSIRAFDWDVGESAGVIVNLSVWTGIEELESFVYGAVHRELLRLRGRWFLPMADAYIACWWVPTGRRPDVAEAEAHVRTLRTHGPSRDAFTLREHYPRP